MRLLFDQNLSFRLADRLADVFPGAAHGVDLQLHRANDRLVWEIARRDGFVLVSKDTDFDDELLYPGPPPKIIRVAPGNGPTAFVEAALRKAEAAVVEFTKDARRLLVVPG